MRRLAVYLLGYQLAGPRELEQLAGCDKILGVAIDDPPEAISHAWLGRRIFSTHFITVIL